MSGYSSYPTSVPVQTDKQTFTSNGTWTKPSWAGANALTTIQLIGGGAGGGSGRKGAAASVRSGGGGGGAGSYVSMTIPTSQLNATAAIIVATAGVGGVAQATNDTDGNVGGNPTGTSTFTSGSYKLRALGGSPGQGGTATGGAGGTNSNGLVQGTAAGGDASTTGLVGGVGGTGNFGGGGGGAGGGITSADVASAGGAGGQSLAGQQTAVGAGGAVDTAGGNTGSEPAGYPLGGAGAGGGGSSITVAGGNGGSAGSYGGGGGGGGASLNTGGNSGAGGNGSAGLVVVITQG